MTFQPVFNMSLCPIDGSVAASPGFGNLVFDANGEGVAFLFEVPYNTTITAVYFRSGTLTAAGDVQFEIQTVDGSGNPSGSLVAAGADVTVNIAVSNTPYKATLTTAPTVTKGQRLFAVARRVSGTFNGNVCTYQDGNKFGIPCPYVRTTAWATSLAASPVFAIYDTSGAPIPIVGNYPFSAISTSSISTTNMFGNRFTMPSYDMKVDRILAWVDFDQNVTFTLYDSDGSTVLATATNESYLPANTNATMNYLLLSAEVTLTAGQNYYLVGKTSASTAAINYFDFLTSAELISFTGYTVAAVNTTTATPTGTGDYTVTGSRLYSVFPVPSAIDIPTGGGGGGLAANPVGGFIG